MNENEGARRRFVLAPLLVGAALVAGACRSANPPGAAALETRALPPSGHGPVRGAGGEPARADDRADAGPDSADSGFCDLLAELGVRYSSENRALEVSGWVNMQQGLVEVFACTPEGKTHESVLVIDCVPSGLHAGLLALGLKSGTPSETSTTGEYHRPTGDPVDIRVRWQGSDGVERVVRAEDWIWNQGERRPMKPCAWIFAGSFMQPVPGSPEQSSYAADYIKSVVTTYHDATSILENPLLEGIDDTVYYSNERAVPAVGTPVTLIFSPAAQ